MLSAPSSSQSHYDQEELPPWLADSDGSLDGSQFSSHSQKLRNLQVKYSELVHACNQIGYVPAHSNQIVPAHSLNLARMADSDVPVETVEELKREMYVAACEAGSTMGVDPKN